MAATLAWENVQETDSTGQKSSNIQRASVPGGWLLRDLAARGHLLFIPDEHHTWGAPINRGREIEFEG